MPSRELPPPLELAGCSPSPSAPRLAPSSGGDRGEPGAAAAQRRGGQGGTGAAPCPCLPAASPGVSAHAQGQAGGPDPGEAAAHGLCPSSTLQRGRFPASSWAWRPAEGAPVIPTRAEGSLGSTWPLMPGCPPCTVPEDLVQGGLWHWGAGQAASWTCALRELPGPTRPAWQACCMGSSSWGPVWETLREARLVPGDGPAWVGLVPGCAESDGLSGWVPRSRLGRQG